MERSFSDENFKRREFDEMNNRQAQLFIPLDKLDGWPIGTYLQQRLAWLKLKQAKEVLAKAKGEDNDNDQ